MAEEIKCLIIGSGPAGYTAAIYAARANMSPILYQGIQPGGQLTTTTDVENFPGYPKGISGPEMMLELQEQAERFGTEIRNGWITKVDFTKSLRLWVNDQEEILCESVIIATGATAKYLGLDSEKKYLELGGGVSACAVCDGFFYKDQDVVIVGAGDSACEEAHYLSKLCKKVTMLVRRNEFRASKIMQERVKRTANIEILYNTETKEVLGNGSVVESVVVVPLTVRSPESVRLPLTSTLPVAFRAVPLVGPVISILGLLVDPVIAKLPVSCAGSSTTGKVDILPIKTFLVIVVVPHDFSINSCCLAIKT